MTFSIHGLTDAQLQVMINALDLYGRLGIGQFSELELQVRMEQLCEHQVGDHTSVFNSLPKKSAADMTLRELKDAAFPELQGKSFSLHHGITSPSVHERFKIAYDLQQAVRHKLAWTRNPNGGMTVEFDTPLITSDQPLPTVEQE